MNFKNFKLGFGIAAAGILIGGLVFSSINKFDTKTGGVMPNTIISNTIKTAEANMYKQFLDLSLIDYKKTNESFKSHGQTNCFVENNAINCSIDNVQFEYINASQPNIELKEEAAKKDSLTIDKVLITNVKDFKTKMELLTNKLDKNVLTKPGYNSSFEVLLTNVKFNNKTQLETVLEVLNEKAVTDNYPQQEFEKLKSILTSNFKQIDIKLKDKSHYDNNTLNSETELNLLTDKVEFGAGINVDLTNKFIELISKPNTELEKLTQEELVKYNMDKLTQVTVNNINLKFTNKDNSFLKDLFETTLKIESKEPLSNEELLKQMDLNYAMILTNINNSPFSEEFKQQFRYKIIEISEGRTSNIHLKLENTSKQNLNDTMQLFMQSKMTQDLSLINTKYNLSIK